MDNLERECTHCGSDKGFVTIDIQREKCKDCGWIQKW